MRRANAVSRIWRTTLVLASIVVAAGTPVFAVTTPAQAAEVNNDLQFSLDGGATWSQTPPASLFDAGFRAVPGDRLESHLLIRSTRAVPTVAMVAITNAQTSNQLFDAALTVQGADGSGAGLPASRLSALAACDAVVPTRVLRAGQALPVTLVVAVAPTLTRNEAVDARARFDLEIALADVGTPTTPNGCPVDPAVIAAFPSTAATGGSIAYTGSDLVYPTLAVGGFAFALGSLFVAVSRRRRAERDS